MGHLYVGQNIWPQLTRACHKLWAKVQSTAWAALGHSLCAAGSCCSLAVWAAVGPIRQKHRKRPLRLLAK